MTDKKITEDKPGSALDVPSLPDLLARIGVPDGFWGQWARAKRYRTWQRWALFRYKIAARRDSKRKARRRDACGWQNSGWKREEVRASHYRRMP